MSRQRIPKNPEQRRVWLGYQLKLAGSSFSKIAREYKVTRQAVHLVNSQPSPKWEAVIARKLGRKPQQIWPERYAA